MIDANTRGEVTITLDAVYTMRPSYEAIDAIETQTGNGIVALINQAANGTMTLKHSAIVVTECMKAWGRQAVAAGDVTAEARGAAGANVDRVARLIHEHGLLSALARVKIVLLGAATGGVTATGEWKPATETETPAAG